MARKRSSRSRGTSPRLDIQITKDQWERAVASKSGGCLIADAIKSQYPELDRVVVDMATIRASDRARGERYTYLTPGSAQHLLLSFDQGWSQSTDRILMQPAVKIDKITMNKKRQAARAARKAQLELKVDSGEPLTRDEKTSMSKLAATEALTGGEPRPATRGPVTDVIGRRAGNATVVGGRPLPQGKPHPNLLRGHDRIFGAKLADPGQAFREAVAEALAQHLEETGAGVGAIQEPPAPALQE